MRCKRTSAKVPHPQALDEEDARARHVGGRRPTTQPSGTNEKFDFGSSESLGTKEKGWLKWTLRLGCERRSFGVILLID